MKRSRVTLAMIEAAAIAALVASPSMIGRCSCSNSGTAKPSIRHSAPGSATRISAERSAVEVRHVQAAVVDAAHAARDDDDAPRAREHARVELLARVVVVLLGVVERAQRAQLAGRQRLVVEQHRRRDQRPGETAATGLVGAGDETHAQPAVEGEEAVAARPPPRRPPRAGVSRQRGAPAELLEEPDAVGRPVRGEGLADDP